MFHQITASAFFIALLALLTFSTPSSAGHVEAELISELSDFQWGQEIPIGLRLKIEPAWHVYWRNPGDSGQPPEIRWTLPEGMIAGEFQWPTPKKLPVGPLTNFGYETEVLLVSLIKTPPTGDPLASVTISGLAKWLVCQETCVPEEKEVSLSIPASSQPGQLSAWHDLFEAARGRLPVAFHPWKLKASIKEQTIALTGKGPVQGVRNAFFFPDTVGQIDTQAQQEFEATPDGWRLNVARADTFDKAATSLRGVLELDGRQRESFELEFSLRDTSGGLLEALALAFLGGLILNLMPCVFPVLFLKVLSVVSLGGAARRKIFSHSASYTLGILTSFWALAGALLALRAGGESLGWGFQLQSPGFIGALCFLIFIMALNLLGVFEFSGRLSDVGRGLTKGEGLFSAFFSGVLATLVATPCTAPFMGTALGYALTQPILSALAVFTSLGLGLAAPYVVLTAIPSLMALLPKPGAWMVSLKQFMAFPLLWTVWWLFSVLVLQVDIPSSMHFLATLVGVALGTWMFGTLKHRVSQILGVMVASISIGLGLYSVGQPAPKSLEAASNWKTYSESAIQEALSTGAPVFIDFTAAWCITCQVNERVALETQEVQAKFKQLGVQLFKADWTSGDAAIAKKLQSFGREGVPLYVFYPGKNQPHKILPNLLTPGIVLEALEARK